MEIRSDYDVIFSRRISTKFRRRSDVVYRPTEYRLNFDVDPTSYAGWDVRYNINGRKHRGCKRLYSLKVLSRVKSNFKSENRMKIDVNQQNVVSDNHATTD